MSTAGKSSGIYPGLMPLTTVLLCMAAAILALALSRHGISELILPLALFLAAALYHRICSARMLDLARRLSADNAALLARLEAEKLSAEAARDLAEKGAKAKSLFIANISHEIRTPLNALLGMAQLLERAGLEKAQRDHVKVMLEAGRGLRTLLDDVITLAREDAPEISESECDPSVAARAVAQLLQPRAWEKRLRLTVSAPPELPRAAGDPRRVRQVLLKLAENALKFTERGAVEILVEAVEEDGAAKLRFVVTDTGHGIAPEIEANLFQPFAPGDASYARKHQGAGLGLAVSRRVIEQAGGRIGFESVPGEGSCFWFTLPVAAGAARPALTNLAEDRPPPSQLHVLLFLRNREMRGQIARLLEPFGNRVSIAEDAAGAAETASRETFDAIVAEAADIDWFAAMPQRRAPLLGLMGTGDRPPASGEAALHWPTRPREFYGALITLRERRLDEVKVELAEAPADMSIPPPIDSGAFAALEKSLGAPVLTGILQSYIETAEQLCNVLAQASQRSDWQEVARLAQDIAGAAGGLGLAAVTSAARGLTAQIRENADEHSLRNGAQMLVGEHSRVIHALTNLYPDLAA